MKYLSGLLGCLPLLQTFSLTKGHQYLDHEPMLHTAQRIFRMNRALPLQQVNVRWARERCANHLKQEGTYDLDMESCSSSSSLFLSAEKKRVLVAWERGITVLGTTFERKFRVPVEKKRRWAPGKGKIRYIGSGAEEEEEEYGEGRRGESNKLVVEVGEVGVLPDSND